MKKFLLGILVGFVFAAAAGVIAGFVLWRAMRQPPAVPGDAVLTLSLEGSLPERPPETVPFFQRTNTLTVRDCWELLKKAAADRRVRAVMLMPADLRAGWGKIEELRGSLEAFKRSGKPVYAWLRAPRTREYYVATAADRIFIAPEDALDLKGLRLELMYLRAGLEKLGVDVEMVHAGKYKDAPEMFTRTGPSPASREALNSLLDDLYGQLVGRIAAARHKTPDQVRAIIDQGPFLSSQALSAGLVDALEYQDEAFTQLKSRLKLKDVHKLSQFDYLRVKAGDAGLRARSRIAFVAAEGDIVRDADGGLLGGEELVTPGGMRELLRRAAGDRDVRGIIVRIDSPGGDSFASDEIWREMSLAGRKKPLVVSMSDVAASGGYYIAMTGDPVVAYPGTVTGSIGVFYGKANLHGLYQKLGVNKEILSRGRFAAIDSDYTPLDAAAREKLGGIVQATYGTFLARVAAGRKRPVGEIAPVAEGRVWLGSQARRNGLVDELGGIDSAIELVKKKAHIPPGEPVMLVSYPARRSILDRLITRPDEPVTQLLTLVRRISTIQWARGGVFYLLPFAIETQ